MRFREFLLENPANVDILGTTYNMTSPYSATFLTAADNNIIGDRKKNDLLLHAQIAEALCDFALSKNREDWDNKVSNFQYKTTKGLTPKNVKETLIQGKVEPQDGFWEMSSQNACMFLMPSGRVWIRNKDLRTPIVSFYQTRDRIDQIDKRAWLSEFKKFFFMVFEEATDDIFLNLRFEFMDDERKLEIYDFSSMEEFLGASPEDDRTEDEKQELMDKKAEEIAALHTQGGQPQSDFQKDVIRQRKKSQMKSLTKRSPSKASGIPYYKTVGEQYTHPRFKDFYYNP